MGIVTSVVHLNGPTHFQSAAGFQTAGALRKRGIDIIQVLEDMAGENKLERTVRPRPRYLIEIDYLVGPRSWGSVYVVPAVTIVLSTPEV